MSNLSQDLIEEILTFLPVKSLFRFKCVSKLWYSLISSSRFAKLHLRRVNEDDKIARWSNVLLPTWPVAQSVNLEAAAASDGDNDGAVLELNYPKEFAFSFSPEYSHNVQILGSCDGLVLLYTDANRTLMLCNPTTKKFRKLWNPCHIRLDPILYPFEGYYTGIGYNSIADDYRVIVAMSTMRSVEVAVEVFSLKTNTWRRVQHPDRDRTRAISLHTAGVYLNQCLHWITKSLVNREPRDEIVAFDIVEERFKNVARFPFTYVNDNRYLFFKLGLFRNRLCVFGDCSESQKHLEAWVFYGTGANATWSKLFSIPYMDARPRLIPFYQTNNGKIILSLNLRRLGLFDCDSKDSKLRCLGSYSDVELARSRAVKASPHQPEVYLESLVSPY